MRVYGSIRLPIFKHFAPRIGFISDRIVLRRPRYNAHAVDSTKLLPGGSVAAQGERQ